LRTPPLSHTTQRHPHIPDPHHLITSSRHASNHATNASPMQEDKNEQYADNLAALERLVLYRFDDDSTGEWG